MKFRPIDPKTLGVLEKVLTNQSLMGGLTATENAINCTLLQYLKENRLIIHTLHQ